MKIPFHTIDARRLTKLAGLGLCAILLAGACSKEDAVKTDGVAEGVTEATSKKVEETSVPTKPGTTAKPEEEPDEGDIAFGQTVSYKGFVITLGKATFTGTAKKYDRKLMLNVSVQNPKEEAASFYGDFALENSTTQVASGRVVDDVKVLPGATTDAVITFNLSDKQVDRAETSLTMGSAKEAQVRVPLSGKGNVVTLAAVSQTPPAPITAGPLTVTINSMEITYDAPGSNTTRALKGKAYLAMKSKIDSTVSYSISQTGMTLLMPDGTTIAAEMLKQDYTPGKKGEALIGFIVPEAYAGSYTLTVTAKTPEGATGATAFNLNKGTGTATVPA